VPYERYAPPPPAPNSLDDTLEALGQEAATNPALELTDEKVAALAQQLLAAQMTKGHEEESSDLRTRIANMKISDKIKLAMFGDVNARGLLIKDPNKLVQSFVLKNPQITFEELIGFASDPNTPKGILRVLSETNKWSKEYQMKLALVCNPKTPLDISMKWVKFLNMADVKKLSKSKSIPNALVVIVRKRMTDLEKKK
jgi:hypothetical protein